MADNGRHYQPSEICNRRDRLRATFRCNRGELAAGRDGCASGGPVPELHELRQAGGPRSLAGRWLASPNVGSATSAGERQPRPAGDSSGAYTSRRLRESCELGGTRAAPSGRVSHAIVRGSLHKEARRGGYCTLLGW